MAFEVHIATAAGPLVGPMSLSFESYAFSDKFLLGAPGLALPAISVPITSSPSFFTLLMFFEVHGDKAVVEVKDVGSDDVMGFLAIPNQVQHSSQLGALLLGNVYHRTPRGASQHCTVTCADGRTQECCIECGSGHARTKICC
jgi:hypothetical protein